MKELGIQFGNAVVGMLQVIFVILTIACVVLTVLEYYQ